jgi:hypothetical protein
MEPVPPNLPALSSPPSGTTACTSTAVAASATGAPSRRRTAPISPPARARRRPDAMRGSLTRKEALPARPSRAGHLCLARVRWIRPDLPEHLLEDDPDLRPFGQPSGLAPQPVQEQPHLPSGDATPRPLIEARRLEPERRVERHRFVSLHRSDLVRASRSATLQSAGLATPETHRGTCAAASSSAGLPRPPAHGPARRTGTPRPRVRPDRPGPRGLAPVPSP